MNVRLGLRRVREVQHFSVQHAYARARAARSLPLRCEDLTILARDFPCPVCSAPIHHPCRSTSIWPWKRMQGVHLARVVKAQLRYDP